jgi:CDP-diacylglycerol--glycerol-3-phosphate 3-phosphatidyltransferase
MGESGAGRSGLNDPPAAAAWSRLHHGIDPSGLMLRTYLAVVTPPARRLGCVPPLVFTVVGAVLAVDAVLLAARDPWVAFGLVLASTACDALDGAVAIASGRVSRAGARADKLADRVADSAFALVLWRCGAPWGIAVAAGALSLLHEALREVRGGALRARITVAERPTRVICAALGTACAAISSATWPVTVCGAVWCALAVVGLAQLARS